MLSRSFYRAFLVLAFALSSMLSAQSKSDPCGPLADRSQIKQFTANIDSIEEHTYCGGTMKIQTLILKDVSVDGIPNRVMLAPDGFLHKNRMHFALGGQVTISGVIIEADGSQILAATEVSSRDRTLKLRDSSGLPRWTRPAAGKLNVGR